MNKNKDILVNKLFLTKHRLHMMGLINWPSFLNNNYRYLDGRIAAVASILFVNWRLSYRIYIRQYVWLSVLSSIELQPNRSRTTKNIWFNYKNGCFSVSTSSILRLNSLDSIKLDEQCTPSRRAGLCIIQNTILQHFHSSGKWNHTYVCVSVCLLTYAICVLAYVCAWLCVYVWASIFWSRKFSDIWPRRWRTHSLN